MLYGIFINSSEPGSRQTWFESERKEDLCKYIDPSDDFLSKLEGKGVLQQWQRQKILSHVTEYERNKQLFEFLKQDNYDDVLNALKETDQEFVINFIVANGGITFICMLTCMLLNAAARVVINTQRHNRG